MIIHFVMNLTLLLIDGLLLLFIFYYDIAHIITSGAKALTETKTLRAGC